MRKLFYVGLERLKERYTYQLANWMLKAFERRGIDYVVVPGQEIDNTEAIHVGQVLDAHGRSFFAMSQMMNLVQMMRNGDVTSEDVIYFEDMFHPGFESLPYIMNQTPPDTRPKVWLRCLAQSIDPDDFIHVWGMRDWMAGYERIVNETATGLLATTEEMIPNMKIAGWNAPLYNISGNAFDKAEVLERLGCPVKPFELRPARVTWSSRWDQEKQPQFFMDMIEKLWDSPIEFWICTGGMFRSNNQALVDRARAIEHEGKLHIIENCTKREYYQVLNDSRVLFNCALQDWSSYVSVEGDTMGANLLFPGYRSFPEVFANDHERLFVPWSQEDAINKLMKLLEAPHKNMGKISDWGDKCTDRIIDILQGDGEEWRRDEIDYRDHSPISKYE